MRKLFFMMSVSLDGYLEGPDREIDWHVVDAELHQHFNDELRMMGCFIEGRVTYELMEGYWPTADQEPGISPQMADFAGPNAVVKREVVPAEIEALKAEPGGDLMLGGADLAATFMEHDLIDEYRVYVHPVLIGAGKPLFPATPELRKVDLRMVGTRTFGNGVVLLRYQPSAIAVPTT